jgi:hypothetical protein
LLPVTMMSDRDEVKPTLIRATGESMLDLDRNHAFELLPGLERNRTPRSSYLFEFFRPILDDLFSLGFGYERAFDEFEILYALEYANQYERDRDTFRYWGPIGRFAWKRNALDEIVSEANAQGTNWLPVRSGLFNGSIDRFKEVAAGIRELIGSIGWH